MIDWFIYLFNYLFKVQQVEKFVLQVNKAMRQRHEHMQLSVLMDKIDSYEAVDVPSDECLKVCTSIYK